MILCILRPPWGVTRAFPRNAHASRPVPSRCSNSPELRSPAMQRPPACGNDATGLGHVTRTTDVLATIGDDRLAFSTSHPYMPAIDISADRSGARVPRVADVYLQNLDTKGENVLVEMQRTQL